LQSCLILTKWILGITFSGRTFAATHSILGALAVVLFREPPEQAYEKIGGGDAAFSIDELSFESDNDTGDALR
jgi:hypothetical protein